MTRNACSAEPARDDGFVLVFVVGFLVLLAVIATALIDSSTLDSKARRALTANQELTAIADGVTRLLAFRLGEQRDGVALPVVLGVDGRPYTCAFAGATIQFTLQDMAGLVDINTVTAGRLTRLLDAAGASDAGQLAAAIVDFRDSDDNAEPTGAEAEAYRLRGMPHGPKNRPFEAVDELDQVLGMSTDVLARLRPLVTVRAPSVQIDGAVTPAALRSIADIGLGTDDPTRPRSDVPDGTSVRLGERGRSRVYSIVVKVRRGDSVSERQSVVEFTPRASAGFVFQSWSSGTHDDVLTRGAAVGACE